MLLNFAITESNLENGSLHFANGLNRVKNGIVTQHGKS